MVHFEVAVDHIGPGKATWDMIHQNAGLSIRYVENVNTQTATEEGVLPAVRCVAPDIIVLVLQAGCTYGDGWIVPMEELVNVQAILRMDRSGQGKEEEEE